MSVGWHLRAGVCVSDAWIANSSIMGQTTGEEDVSELLPGSGQIEAAAVQP